MFKYYNVLRRFCAFLVGMVFFLSGLLKLLDPVGAGLVVGEYLKFLHLDFLSPLSLIIGVGMALVETILGTALMVGLWRKVVSIVTFSVLGFFTILTLVLLIFNPVMDCGCFGEAIHLTHLQTFIKNIILLGLSFVAFIPGKLGHPRKRKYVAFGIVCALVVGFTVYSLLYIPLVDFTEFKPGARLEACGDGFTATYTAYFVYERDGEERTFTLNNLPDSTWTYVRTDTVREETSDDSIALLSFYDEAGNYLDELATEGDVLVFSVYNMKRMSEKRWAKVASAVQDAEEAGFTTIILSQRHFEMSVTPTRKSSKSLLPEDATEPLPITLSSYITDYKTILTMNRSNGGATYFHNGTLVRKWARRALPSYNELTKNLAADMVETIVEAGLHRNLVYEGLVILLFGILFFV